MDQSLSQITAPITNGIKRYHATIAIVIIALLIAFAIFRLYQIVIVSSEKGVNGYTPVKKVDGNFDQKTIDRIENLKAIDESDSPLQFPARQSPFTE